MRAEAKKRGLAYLGAYRQGLDAIHPEAVEPDLADQRAGCVVGNEADRPTWEGMKKLLAATVDEAVRGRVVYALSVAVNDSAARGGLARENFTLDPRAAQTT